MSSSTIKNQIMITAASPSPLPTDLDLARARLLVAHADQARKKPKGSHNSHKGTKVAADKENEDLGMKKKKVISVVYVSFMCIVSDM